MAGRKAVNWSPYDFTPITLPHLPKKRRRHASPQSYQTSDVIFSDTDFPQRTQTLPEPLLNTEDNEQAVRASPVMRKSHRRGQSQLSDATSSISPAPNRARATSRVPGIGDILGGFKQPEARPTFKEEPVDEDTMRLPLRRPVSARRRYEKIRAGTPAASKLTTASARRQQQRKIKRGREQSNKVAQSDHNKERNAVVDLTAEDEEGPQAQNHDTGITVQHQYDTPPYQAPVLPQYSGHDKIPETALQQVKEQYRQEHVILPTYVKTWHQLEDFAGRNQNQSCVTPTFLSRIRDFYATLSLKSHGINSSNPQSLFFGQGASQDCGNRGPFPRYDRGYAFDTQRPLSGNVEVPFPALSTASETGIRREHNIQFIPSASAQHPLRGPTHRDPVYRTTLRPRDEDERQSLGSLLYPHDSGQFRSREIQSLSTEIISVLTQPSDALPDLLPSTTPSDHPHLVSLWNPDLLRLPNNQHGHLNLVDTVVSIIAKYDMKDLSAIKAFLDINNCPHFFFLFKSRTSDWHSWSIEREWDVVTIGLERNSRASNTAESTRPSSGQFDVTVIFRMHPSTSVNATLLAANDSNPNTSTGPATDTDSPPLPSTNDSLSAIQAPPLLTTIDSPKTTLPTRSQPIIPGKWNLYGTTIFPAQPSLPTFLWSTPPNRGADDVSRYHHPTQTSLLPLSHLSMLARYLQHTAFTCTAMEAEFQVAWGRKVRYDAQLGRVRPTWDYALKGAKTQKEKRKRGDYNVVPAAEKKSGGNGGGNPVTQTTKDDGDGRGEDTMKKGCREERPGAGVSLDWLAGRDGVKDVKPTGTEEPGTTMLGMKKVGKGRKRPKREEGDGSGSEYMNSSDEE